MVAEKDRPNPIGVAKGVLFGIADAFPQFYREIHNRWNQIMRLRDEQQKAESAWALVREYSIKQADALVKEVEQLTTILCNFANGECREIGLVQRTGRDRLSMLRLQSTFGNDSDRALIIQIIKEAQEICDICQDALEMPEASLAKQEWLKSHAVAEANQGRANSRAEKAKEQLAKKQRLEQRRLRDKALTISQKERSGTVLMN